MVITNSHLLKTWAFMPQIKRIYNGFYEYGNTLSEFNIIN